MKISQLGSIPILLVAFYFLAPWFADLEMELHFSRKRILVGLTLLVMGLLCLSGCVSASYHNRSIHDVRYEEIKACQDLMKQVRDGEKKIWEVIDEENDRRRMAVMEEN